MRWKLVCVSLGCITLGLTACGRPNNLADEGSSILSGATFVADTSTWQCSAWLNDHDILVVEKAGAPNRSVFRLETGTGKRTSLAASGQLLRSCGDLARLSPSPDGKWVMAMTRDYASNPFRLIRVADGKLIRSYSAGSFTCWLRDSSGWLRFDSSKSIVVNAVSGESHRVPVNGVEGMPILCSLDNGRVLFREMNCYHTPPLRVHEVDLRSGRVVESRTISAPDSQWLTAASASSDGRRYLLAGCERVSGNKILGYVQEMVPRRPNPNPYWITSVGGRRVWSLGPPPEPDPADQKESFSVSWIPGGKYIAVVNGRSLYRLRIG